MGSSASQASIFSGLPQTRLPLAEFAFGTGTQVAAVALLMGIRVLFPPVVSTSEHRYDSVRLVDTPVAINPELQPIRSIAPQRLPMPRVTAAMRLPPAQRKTVAKVVDVPAPAVTIANKIIDSLPRAASPILPREAVKLNLFSSGSSAAANIVKPASQVQSAEFGDPDGIPAKTNQQRAANIATTGSFDLPSGSGRGDGPAERRSEGIVASAGFGNETALPGRARATNGVVQGTAFASSVISAANVKSISPERSVPLLPAEILSKPSPLYTPEARSLRIQGEVLLEVVLQATGNLQVVRVVQGLGHGLDDNAVKAAQQIRFKPAMRDGHPADSTVVLHVVFQLA